MSFRFNFSNDSDVSLNDNNYSSLEIPPAVPPSPHVATPPRFHTLEELASTLPQNISYKILTIPNASNQISIPRRELYDVHMQLMAEDDDLPTDYPINSASHSLTTPEGNVHEKERTALLSFIAGNEDVHPSVYEGGLKSWECSVDLTQYLSTNHLQNPTNILELGCGTSLPSLYLFQQALQATKGAYTFHLADYNYSVLQLVTLPNILLSWVQTTSPHLLTLPNGDLDVTEDLKSSFLSSLQSVGITIGFISGSWGDEMLSLLSSKQGSGYDLVLGSETIYEPRTIGEFTKVLLSALGTKGRGLVSAKRIYFGVGGSVGGFIELVRKREREGEGWNVREVETIEREKGGVGGVILEVKKEVEMSV